MLIFAEDFGERIVSECPKATNRYARAWGLAARAVGLRKVPVLAIVPRPTWFVEKTKINLRQQMIAAQSIFDRASATLNGWYTAKHRKDDKFSRMLKRRIARAAKKIAGTKKALEDLERLGGEGLLIGGRKYGKRDPGGVQSSASRVLGLYGGTGSVHRSGTTSIVVLRNLEPHARIVESRTHIVGRLVVTAKAFGVRRVKASLIKSIQEAAKVAA